MKLQDSWIQLSINWLTEKSVNVAFLISSSTEVLTLSAKFFALKGWKVVFSTHIFWLIFVSMKIGMYLCMGWSHRFNSSANISYTRIKHPDKNEIWFVGLVIGLVLDMSSQGNIGFFDDCCSFRMLTTKFLCNFRVRKHAGLLHDHQVQKCLETHLHAYCHSKLCDFVVATSTGSVSESSS